MKTSTIIDAAANLDRAATALRLGNLSIAEQITLAGDLNGSAHKLRRELELDCPEVKAVP